MSPRQIAKCATFLTLTALTALALVVIVRTILFTPAEADLYCSSVSANGAGSNGGGDVQTSADHKAITADRGLIERFQQALRFRTVTKAPKDYSVNETHRFIHFLQSNFSRVHSSPLVTLEIVNGLSLLYHVKGSNSALKPYMVLAHLDVVPVQEHMWRVPPFDGVLQDGFIYGRGALDLKSVVMGALESLEFMLEHGTPIERSFYIAIGHDEEGRGLDGAAEIARYMTGRGLNDVEFILDEGPYIFRNALPGLSARDVAMIGVAEKGLVNMRLTVNGTVGHSSLPPRETAIVKLARAVSKLHANSHPNQFGQGPERDMVEAMAPYASLPYRILYSNLWLFSPLVARLLEADKLMNSFIRTTTAVTIFQSGIKDNVLPGRAEATVNHRIYPLNSVADTLATDVEVIDDEDVDVAILGRAIEPHPISPYGDDTFGYQTIRASIQQVFPGIAIIPGMMYAATDTRWFLNFTRNIYRFSPAYITLDDFGMVHGHNERISEENYLKLVNFYHHVMLNANKAQLDLPPPKDEF
ncbi:PREDICTED: probable carboxypeptidase PM20D1 [Rhagoletis zephyria]|uniref:probable carboxypeptidase PM20D1 n=1 Tax=Rhagoletis zephyria TaxID=28612 RepID=UPI000811A4EE|nr:PREDICTED: probable carboxypeptidase PM20D1 [Rhagoletis zephyria]KAH9400302.1 hypothetical protein TYRP_001863 [Tyrophagus putrescentiae]